MTAILKFVRSATTIVLALLMVLFGYLIAMAGYQTLRHRIVISASFAAIGALWIVVGPVMLAGAVWVLVSLGRKPIPFYVAGVAALLCGGSLIAGVLTYVIPCSGPS